MKLKQVHRMVKFKQSPWLKAWVYFNTKEKKLTAILIKICLS